MRRRCRQLALLCAAAALLAGGLYCALTAGPAIEDAELVGRLPRIRPDYTDVVIPPNIAPLNFCIDEEGTRYHVRIHSTLGEQIEIRTRGPRVQIPLEAWRRLLNGNRGAQLRFDVYVKGRGGNWRRFDTVTNTVAPEQIDGYMVYRWIGPGYNLYEALSIRQRNLQNYEESLVLDNSSLGHACINCHTFLGHAPGKMVIQMRSNHAPYGHGMVMVQDGTVTKVDTQTRFSPSAAVYTSWHPSGRVLAFSTNKVRQFFHSARMEVREVVDLDSDLGIYLLDSHAVASTGSISRPDRLETWPAWSADGRSLYFCSAPVLWSDRDKVPPERYREVRYDLMRIGYDVDSGAWGEPETILSAAETGLSISQPRVSPDGRFVLFCMSEYGTFPIHLAGTDLYLLDLKTGQHRRLACNSDESDSWHCWSSNGRWIVFSSRRADGLFSRPYFSYIDEDGSARNPFVLPQEDPTFYDSLLMNYNVPELIREPVEVSGEQIVHVIRSEPWTRSALPVTGPTPRAASPP